MSLKVNRPTLGQRIRRQKWVLLMLVPLLVLTIIFSYLPLTGWVMAFTDYNIGASLFGNEWTGLKQFVRLGSYSTDLIRLLRNTVVINFVSVFNNLTCALLLTLLLREVKWRFGAKAIQTVTFFPYFVSAVIAYAIFNSLFSVNSGAINMALVRSGLIDRGYNILGDAKYSWGLMIMVNLWKFTGYNCVLFMAAAAGIPLDQYESADIDGASRFQKAVYITLPSLLPTAAVLLIMNSGWILNSSLDMFMVFQNTTNMETMEVLDMYIYKYGLKLMDYSYATAAGIVKTGVSLLLLVIVNKSVKKLSGTGIF
ncbi:MAG TPA: sugar ABC transporter permease [Candidatus Faecivicinus avistercoris]|nr:sugar ABC transporter permease [Candidatus Faecivicinus avistercoris]